ncbi:disease resistance protein L6-like [Syzygium oleosum]|uniref:disease resistance protein L6-like n=1 Tax=Syzygium oleosum TaxID=219896 RepID=UPI0011D18BBE|nr:disease resistance protein L6-like [Syzygium oleosum]XP_056166507.1 disease resistance protein L6-like [Syzygium oleosum]
MEPNRGQALITILALTVARVLQVCNFCLTNSRRNRDLESSSRMDDRSGEKEEALRRDSESTSRTDNASHEEFDVLLSFRGPDTRNGFANCLYHRLRDAGIRVFLDNEELQVGKEIGGELLKVHEKSRIYIPIFYKGYANSSWCLREVALMVECTSTSDGKKEILPIFYDVDPNDVKLKTELYRKAIPKHKKKFGSDELKRWEKALVEVAHLKGWDLKGKGHGEQIELIVEEVSRKLNTRHMIVTEHFVEDSAQMEGIMKLLDVSSGGVHFVGIHGMGGVGKTTLAKVIFNELTFHFERCSFLEDVRASSQPPGGLIELQKKLLSDLAGYGIANQIKDVDGGTTMIKKALSSKKVLIVLDDLDKKEQLEKLAGKSNWFCSGSRIIITTRDESILMTQVGSSSKKVLNQPKGVLRYEVQEMRFDLALHLFYKHAFRSDSVIEEYDTLSREIVCTVGMLPLAVVVIGSNLFDWGKDLGRSDKREVWDETLKKLKESPFEDVRDTLMISYERLEDKHKEVFLDIACFFINADRTYPVIMWKDCGYFPSIAMRVLSQRSLIKIRDDNRFWMHDQVRDFGRYIVLRRYPRKFCRVWIREDALKLLEGKKRNEDVEALSLASNGYSRNIASEELAALPNLRFLRVKGIDFFGNFKNRLSKLTWFSWEITSKEFYAESFHFTSLVVLDLSRSDIEDDWGGWSQIQMTEKLKVLDLTDCTKLRRTPDFSNFMSLETLILARCTNLITINPSISKLQLLKTLNIKGCSSLGELPEEVGSLQSLKHIVMPQNFQPLKLPEIFGNLISLSSFRLNEHPKIPKLPDSIGGATNLTSITLRGCVGIKELPSSIGELKMLAELDVSTSGVIELPDSIGNLKKLRVLRLCRSQIKEFPHTIGGLEMLEGLYAHKSYDLTDKNLEEIGKLIHLKTLDLAFTSVSRLPLEISRLHLQNLKVGSIELRHVPALPSSLKFLAVQAMDFSLVPHPSSITDLEHLELYRFSNLRIREHSTRLDYDSKLKAALMREQPSYQLPSHLLTLKLRSISPLPHFSNLLNLKVLHVIECPISHLLVTPGLTHLRELHISRCESLEEIPGLSLLKSLERLELKGLNVLVEIQGLAELQSLQYLLLSGCDLLGKLPNLNKLGKLQHLELEACPNLRAIEGMEGLESWVLDSRGRTILERMPNISRSTWLSHILPMYDVFFSFKGPDTHFSIVNYLHYYMLRDRVSVYSHDDDLRSGEGIGEEILQALTNSNIYIPVFSRNYASSHRCLRELAYMVKCTSESKGKRRILPIFYDVEIDDVKLETDIYKNDLDKHRMNFDHNEVKSWKEALIEVAAMRGFVWKNNSYEEVLQIIISEVFRARKLLDVDS